VVFSAAYGQQTLARSCFLDGGDTGTASKITDANRVEFLNAAHRGLVPVTLEDAPRMSANGIKCPM
jgi:hypothetical protein